MREKVRHGDVTSLPAGELKCHSPVNDPIKSPPGLSSTIAKALSAHLEILYTGMLLSCTTWSTSRRHMSPFNYLHPVLIVMPLVPGFSKAYFTSCSKSRRFVTSQPNIKSYSVVLLDMLNVTSSF